MRILLFALLPLSLCAATEYHVSLTGDDSNAGTAPAEAWRTIQYAVDRLQPGDTLTIAPGEYVESVYRKNIGSADVDTIIRAQIPGTVLLRGDVPVDGFTPVDGFRWIYSVPFDETPYSVAEADTFRLKNDALSIHELEFLPGTYHYDSEQKLLYISTSDLQPPDAHDYRVSVTPKHGFFLENPVRVILDGIAVTGFNNNEAIAHKFGGNHWGIYFTDPVQSTIRNCTAYLNGGGILMMSGEGDGGNTIEDCVAYGNYSRFNQEGGNIAIYRPGVGDVLRGNTVYLSAGHGQRFYLTARENILMENCFGWGNQAGDLWIKVGGGKGIAARNLIGFSSVPSASTHSLQFAGKGGAHVREPESSVFVRDESGFDEDKEFIDPIQFDFRLQRTSSLRGSGPDGSDRGPFPYDGTVYFVSPTGNDRASGGAVAEAWQSLTLALARLKPGDTLYLLEGTYADNAALQTDGVTLRARGFETVVLTGKWQVSGSNQVLERLNWAAPLQIANADNITLNNNCFSAKSTLTIRNSTNFRLSHNLIMPTVSISQSTAGFLSGNHFGGSPGLQIDDVATLTYSDYNAYAAANRSWDENGKIIPLSSIPDNNERYSQSAALNTAPDGWPINCQSLAATGPLGKPIGLNFPNKKRQLQFAGPFIHSVTTDTANLEWWASDPLSVSFSWGEADEPHQRHTVNQHLYSGYSLTGLAPGTTYSYELRLNAPFRFLATQTWLDFPAEAVYRGTFTTATEPHKPRDWYVSPDGDDANCGSTAERPLRSVNVAANQTRPGDTVWLAGGDYHETVWIRTTGTHEEPITFRNMPGEKVHFNGISRKLFAAFAGFSKHHLRFDGFYASELGRLGSHDGAHLAVDVGGMYVFSYSADIQMHRSLKDGRGVGYSVGFCTLIGCPGALMKNSVAIRGFGRPRFTASSNVRIENSVFFLGLINQLMIDGNPRTGASGLVRNNIFTDGLASKRGAHIIAAGPTVIEKDNCFFPRSPMEEKLLYSNADLKKSGSILADPGFRMLVDVPRTNDAGDPIYPVDRSPRRPVDFSDFFATNPEVIKRDMGLQPAAFTEFNFDE